MIANGYDRITSQKDFLINILPEVSNLIGKVGRSTVSLNGKAVIPGLGLEAEAETLVAQAKDLNQGIFKVLVYGGFNNGKSTLLNALLRNKLLPTDILECTAIITVLVYGENDLVEVCETGTSRNRLISHKDFIREFKVTDEDREMLSSDGVMDRFENIEYAQVQCTSQLCANGVRLVDAPGLGATSTRTTVANNYLREAHAVILVLDASRILDKSEKSFIRQEFIPGQVSNTFFVVNKINLIGSEENVQKIKVEMRRFLEPLYVQDNKFNEDLYNRRIFFIDALKAEEAVLHDPVDLADFEASEVLAFENELESFLTSEEKNKAALYEATNELTKAIGEAQQYIARQKSLRQIPLEDLERQVNLANARLDAIQSRLVSVENIISKTSERVSSQLSSSLEDYIREMQKSWVEDSESLNWDALRFENFIDALGEAGRAKIPLIGDWLANQNLVDKQVIENKIKIPLKRELEGYLQNKITVWSSEIAPILVQDDISQMLQELEGFLTEFNVELNNVYTDMPDFKPEVGLSMNWAKWGQLILTLLMRDWGGISGVLLQNGELSPFIARIVQQIGIVVILASVSNIFGVLLVVTWEAWQGWKDFKKFKEQLRIALGKKLFDSLEQKSPEMRQRLQGSVRTKFSELSDLVKSKLAEQIESRRREFELVRTQLEDNYFSFDIEKDRLNAIDSRLTEIREKVATVS